MDVVAWMASNRDAALFHWVFILAMASSCLDLTPPVVLHKLDSLKINASSAEASSGCLPVTWLDPPPLFAAAPR
jgi:hypothetical protein